MSSKSATPAAPKTRRVPKGTMPAAKMAEATPDDHKITDEQKAADRKANAAMQFAVQQMSTPVAPQTPPAAIAAFQAELAALQAKHGIAPKTVVVKAPRPEKVQQNGVTRPGATTTCGKIWAAADAISAEIHGVCPVALLKVHPTVVGINDHTIKTQYARWRAYNGVVGRLPTIQAVHQVAGVYDGIPTV